MAAPISASSRTWVGPAGSSSSTTTPQRSRIGRHAPVGSMSADDHGPAATRTASAVTGRPSTMTPADRVAADVERGSAALADRSPRAVRRASRRRRSKRPAGPGSRSRPGRPTAPARAPARAARGSRRRPRRAAARGTPRPAPDPRRGPLARRPTRTAVRPGHRPTGSRDRAWTGPGRGRRSPDRAPPGSGRTDAGRRPNSHPRRPRRAPRRSTIVTRAPPSARNAAADAPTIPPPTTMTSGRRSLISPGSRSSSG